MPVQCFNKKAGVDWLTQVAGVACKVLRKSHALEARSNPLPPALCMQKLSKNLQESNLPKR